MNRTLLTWLAVSLLVGATPLAVAAQTAPEQRSQLIATGIEPTPLIRHFNPFQLVNFAYEGRLQAQGIPGYGQLENAYRRHQVDAQALVAAAVRGGYVPSDRADDGNYINAVRLQMRSLKPDSSHYYGP